jgi:TolB-like protein
MARFTNAVMLLTLAALAEPAAAAPEPLEDAAAKLGADLAAGLAAAPERASVRQVTVAPFAETGAGAGLGARAADAVGARLAAAGLTVTDRAKLAALVGEQRLAAMAGKAGAEAELTKLAGAQALLVGEATDGGDRLVLSARLVAPGGRVLASARREAALPSRAKAASPVESTAIEVGLRRVSDGLAEGFGRLQGNPRYRRLAVLQFAETGDAVKKRQLGTVVAAELATRLSRDHGLILVERTRLGEVLGELRLQQATGIDPAAAEKIGSLADAQALVLGSVSEVGDRFLVNARVVATGSGETLATESASVQAAGLVAVASDAVVLRSRSGAVFRSALVPGFGQFYNRQPGKGLAFLSAEVALLGTALGYHVAGNAAADDYAARTRADQLGGQPSAEAARLYDDATSRYHMRDVLLLCAAGVWAVNVADAWFSGVDGEALLGGAEARRGGVEPVASAGPGFAYAGARLRF